MDGIQQDWLQVLNRAQKQAVMETEGFVRLIAGAGSGKTRTLAYRFAWLVNELGILPGNILCVSFTNKSAMEMRQRIHTLCQDEDTGMITTFHGFCNTLLLEESHILHYPKSFLVLDNADIDDMLQIIYEERNLSLRDMSFSAARDMIEICKLKTCPRYYEYLLDFSLEALQEKYKSARQAEDIIFFGYLYNQRKCFGLDYNDLIILSLEVFRRSPQTAQKWQERLEYIMIDEFQDIDGLQYELMERLCQFHKNLFVVGDPDQTIYTWRGASVKFLLDFDQHFPGCKTLYLNENYRSTPQILQVCNSLIACNKQRLEKDLLPVRENGRQVQVYVGKSAQEEAAWIAGSIAALLKKGYQPEDMAILYRAHYISQPIEEALLALKIPYTLYSGVPFFARTEIKDALSWLRMLAWKDDLSFRRTINKPKRNFGKRRMAHLEGLAAQSGTSLYQTLQDNAQDPLFASASAASYIQLIEESETAGLQVSTVLTRILERSGYEKMLRLQGAQDRLDNLAQLVQSVHTYEIQCGEEASLEDYLRHVALFSSDEKSAGQSVRLMSVHTAKGLEFDHVFLAGLAEGMFPAKKTSTLQAMEEERRLAFVAMSRARDTLHLSLGQGSNFDGSPRYPSRFLLDIPPQYLEFVTPLPENMVQDARTYIQLSSRRMEAKEMPAAFASGDVILHPAFGQGTILEVNRAKGYYVIHFDTLQTERKIAFKARLEKIQSDGWFSRMS